jgi:hypothetical protein
MNTELIYELCDYILVDGDGRVLDTARLTKREALAKNQAFGLNHVLKRYILKRVFGDEASGPILIVPKG